MKLGKIRSLNVLPTSDSKVDRIAIGTTRAGFLYLAVAVTGGSYGRNRRTEVQLWDPLAGSKLRTLTAGMDLKATALCFGFSRDDQLVVAAADVLGDVWIWNADSGVGGSEVGLGIGPDQPVDVEFAFGVSDGGRILRAFYIDGWIGDEQFEGPINLGYADQFRPIVTVDEGSGRVTEFAIGITRESFTNPNQWSEPPRDGRVVLAAGYPNGEVRLWDVASGRMIRRASDAHSGSVTALEFGNAKDGGSVLASSGSASIQLWNGETGEVIGDPIRADARVSAIALGRTKDGQLLLAGADTNQSVTIWDVESATVAAGPISTPANVTFLSFASAGEKTLLAMSSESENVLTMEIC